MPVPAAQPQNFELPVWQSRSPDSLQARPRGSRSASPAEDRPGPDRMGRMEAFDALLASRFARPGAVRTDR